MTTIISRKGCDKVNETRVAFRVNKMPEPLILTRFSGKFVVELSIPNTNPLFALPTGFAVVVRL